MGWVENSEFSENSETLENKFPRLFHSEFSIVHCTENRKLGDENPEISLRHLDQTPRFPNSDCPFCTTLKTENSELKTSEFTPRHYDQTPRFSNSEFSILHNTHNRKLGVENLGVFSKVHPNSNFDSLRVYHFSIVADFSSEKYSGSTGHRNSWYQ